MAKFQRVLASNGELLIIHDSTDNFTDSGRPLFQETVYLKWFCKIDHRWAQINTDETQKG